VAWKFQLPLNSETDYIPDSADCYCPLCSPDTTTSTLWPLLFYTNHLLRLTPSPYSLSFSFPFSSQESLLLSQLIFVAVVVYRFFLPVFLSPISLRAVVLPLSFTSILHFLIKYQKTPQKQLCNTNVQFSLLSIASIFPPRISNKSPPFIGGSITNVAHRYTRQLRFPPWTRVRTTPWNQYPQLPPKLCDSFRGIPASR
jgi:hypothetical protein